MELEDWDALTLMPGTRVASGDRVGVIKRLTQHSLHGLLTISITWDDGAQWLGLRKHDTQVKKLQIIPDARKTYENLRKTDP